MPEPVQISPISILGDHTVTVARQSRHGGQVFREDMKNYREEALGNATIGLSIATISPMLMSSFATRNLPLPFSYLNYSFIVDILSLVYKIFKKYTKQILQPDTDFFTENWKPFMWIT